MNFNFIKRAFERPFITILAGLLLAYLIWIISYLVCIYKYNQML